MKWAVTCGILEDGRCVCVCVCVCIGFWWGDLKEVNHFEDLGLDGRIIENESSRYEIGWHGMDSSGIG